MNILVYLHVVYSIRHGLATHVYNVGYNCIEICILRRVVVGQPAIQWLIKIILTFTSLGELGTHAI